MTPQEPAESRALRWLARLIPRRHREEWLGDLVERWHTEAGPCPSRSDRGRLYLAVARSALIGRAHGVGEYIHTQREGAVMGRGLPQDIRIGVRTLRREPVASGAAFLTMALGMWAFLTAFALLDRALLRPLGYEAEDRLVVVGRGESALFGVSYPDHLELSLADDLVEEAACWQGWSVLFRSQDGPWQRASAASVSADFFAMLGVEPAFGRFFLPDEEAPGHAPAVVLSYATWQERFGGERDVLGRTIDADGTAYTIVGVAPSGFRDPMPRLFGFAPPALWRVSPPGFDPTVNDRGQVSFWSLARVRPGVPLGEFARRVRSDAARIYGSPEAADDLDARPYVGLVERRSRGSLLLLLGSGAGVLLIALANVTNLLLARGTGRVREMAVRASVGGGRLRLVRQLLVEGGVLGVAGGVVGLGLTALTLRPVAELSRSLLPPGTDVSIDVGTVVLALLLAVAVSVGAALLPAWRATHPGHLATLREGRGTGGGRTPLQSALVVAQTALAIVLLASSGLLLRSLWALGRLSPGFDADRVTAVRVTLLPELFADEDERSATVEALAARVAGLPGVEAVSGITDLPLSGAINSTVVRRTDLADDDPGSGVTTLVRGVLPGFARVMGVRVVEGRDIEATDRAGAPEVAVVNRSYAERAFPDGDAVGRVVDVRGTPRTIVGVVENVHEFTLVEGGNAVLYQPFLQTRQSWMRSSIALTVRSPRPPSAAAFRAAVTAVDGRLPSAPPRPLTWYVDLDLAGHRFRALLAVCLGGLALVLAAVGLAGVTAYTVGRRTHELGVRMALGAAPRGVAGLVLAGSAFLTAVGAGLGLVGAVLIGRMLAGFLYEVRPFDPWTLITATLVLGATALMATLGPVRRALAVDPVDALREE